MRKWILFLLFPLSLLADKVPYSNYLTPHPEHRDIKEPWFTGPLLAPSAFTIPAGHVDFEPYLYIVANKGLYDHDWKVHPTSTFWNNSFQPLVQVGITKWLDVEVIPALFYNYTHGAGKWAIGDTSIGFDFQLFSHQGRVTEWVTAVKLNIKETIPTGKYSNLDPKKLVTDAGGMGSWQTSIDFVWGNLFYLGRGHFLTWRNSLQYTLPAPTHVKNLSVYGGAQGTEGTIYPAQNLQFDTAIEISLTQNWAFAMDFLTSWSGKTRFKGHATAPIGPPPSVQFSLAPAIEYNWSANLGIIFGPWFTIAGRNAIQFFDGVFAFNYYY